MGQSGGSSQDSVLIGNAGGYWGDDPYALRRQLEGPLRLDYIAMDFLAEITMSILQKQKTKNPEMGYATDFVSALKEALPLSMSKKTCLVTNAGGVNPMGCAQAVVEMAKGLGLNPRIAVVDGDSVVHQLGSWIKQGVSCAHMETGEPLEHHQNALLAANVYFGALPIVEALKLKPDIVICGRVTDTALTLAPMAANFGWSLDNWDALAHGIVAGHILECGAQATGGNFTDWHTVPSFHNMGFPIVECFPSGEFVVTKQPGSGGLVTCQTLREQLLYEMGDPEAYITPDVVVDFTSIQLEQVGVDRVRVWGITGKPPTNFLKVSVALSNGYKMAGTLLVGGPHPLEKARALGALFWKRLDEELHRQGLPLPVAQLEECVGATGSHRGLLGPIEPTEVLLRVGLRSPNKDTLAIARKLLPSLILSGPPGVAVTGGAPPISDVVSYWPALIPQELALPRISVWENGQCRVVQDGVPWPLTQPYQRGPSPEAPPKKKPLWGGNLVQVPLLRLAHGRSGDKGDMANVGIIGRTLGAYEWLEDALTSAMMDRWLEPLGCGPVQRHTVPNLWALNFLIPRVLGGGGTVGLYIDAQGKTLAQSLLSKCVMVPQGLLDTLPPEGGAP